MDDCSGNSLGRELLQSYNFGSLPCEPSQKLREEYDLGADEIKTMLYQKPYPDVYLADFAKFVVQHKNHCLFQEMIQKQT